MTRFKLFFFIFSVRLSGRIAAAGGDVQTNLRSAEEKGKKKIKKKSPIFVNQQAEKNGEGNLLFFLFLKRQIL